MSSISTPDHCTERPSLVLLSAYQEYLMTFKLMTPQVVQRARPLITHICVIGAQRVKLTTCIFGIINNSFIGCTKNECLCFHCNLSAFVSRFQHSHIPILFHFFGQGGNARLPPTTHPKSKGARRPTHVSKPNNKNHNVRPSYLYMIEVVYNF